MGLAHSVIFPCYKPEPVNYSPATVDFFIHLPISARGEISASDCVWVLVVKATTVQ